MQVQCDKCGCDTRPKQITSKKTHKTYTVYECLGECMNGQYKYSCFAPKVGAEKAATSLVADYTTLLEEIRAICLAINAKLPAKAKKVVMNRDCDEDGVPFPTEEDAPF